MGVENFGSTVHWMGVPLGIAAGAAIAWTPGNVSTDEAQRIRRTRIGNRDSHGQTRTSRALPPCNCVRRCAPRQRRPTPSAAAHAKTKGMRRQPARSSPGLNAFRITFRITRPQGLATPHGGHAADGVAAPAGGRGRRRGHRQAQPRAAAAATAMPLPPDHRSPLPPPTCHGERLPDLRGRGSAPAEVPPCSGRRFCRVPHCIRARQVSQRSGPGRVCRPSGAPPPPPRGCLCSAAVRQSAPHWTCVQCENGKSISPIDSTQPTMAHDADTDSDLARPPDGNHSSARHATPGMLLWSATRRRAAGHVVEHPGSCDSE
jgi:hypothetical protein